MCLSKRYRALITTGINRLLRFVFSYRSNGVERRYAIADCAVCMHVCMLRNVTGNKRLNLEESILAYVLVSKVRSHANFHRNRRRP